MGIIREYTMAPPLAAPNLSIICEDTRKIPYEQWLLLRRQGFGASDIPCLLGYSNFSSAYDIWAQKTGQAALQDPHESIDDEFRKGYGDQLEDLIRDCTAKKFGLESEYDKRMYRRTDIPCFVNIDGRYLCKTGFSYLGHTFPPGTRIGAEIKTTNRANIYRHGWDKAPPAKFVIQCKAELSILNGALPAVLLTINWGNDLSRDTAHFLITLSDTVKLQLEEYCSLLWSHNVVKNIPPSEIAHNAHAERVKKDLLKHFSRLRSQLKTQGGSAPSPLPKELLETVVQAHALRRQISEIAAEKKAAKYEQDKYDTNLIKAMKTCKKGYIESPEGTYEVSVITRETHNFNALELKKQYPKVYKSLIEKGILTANEPSESLKVTFRPHE